MLYNESNQTNIATFTKEGASRKYYTSFYIHIQPFEEIKFMQLFLAALDKIIFRDYNYNSVIYHCYIGGVTKINGNGTTLENIHRAAKA